MFVGPTPVEELSARGGVLGCRSIAARARCALQLTPWDPNERNSIQSTRLTMRWSNQRLAGLPRVGKRMLYDSVPPLTLFVAPPPACLPSPPRPRPLLVDGEGDNASSALRAAAARLSPCTVGRLQMLRPTVMLWNEGIALHEIWSSELIVAAMESLKNKFDGTRRAQTPEDLLEERERLRAKGHRTAVPECMRSGPITMGLSIGTTMSTC